jgi:hypothetical protein
VTYLQIVKDIGMTNTVKSVPHLSGKKWAMALVLTVDKMTYDTKLQRHSKLP